MTDTDPIDAYVVQAAEHLFQYAIHRDDMTMILDTLPLAVPERRVALEYEIQALRIISVGWAIAFHLSDDPLKTPLGEHYWENVRSFSQALSSSASLTTGSVIDYFEILKQRLDLYVRALDAAGEIAEPAMAIGPAFAGACGDKDDAMAMLAGSKMFSLTIGAVKEYLDGDTVQKAPRDS